MIWEASTAPMSTSDLKSSKSLIKSFPERGWILLLDRELKKEKKREKNWKQKICTLKINHKRSIKQDTLLK